MIMSLIEKALRQLERDKQKAGFSAFPGAPQPSAVAEEFYEKAVDAAGGHIVEDRGALRSWKPGVIAGAALLLVLGGAALWYLQQGGEKAAELAAPVPQLKTVPVAAAPSGTGAPAAAAVSPPPQRDENQGSAGRVSVQQPAVAAVPAQAPAPAAAHGAQDAVARPVKKYSLPAAAQPQPVPQQIERSSAQPPHTPAAASRQRGADKQAARSAVSAGDANLLQQDSEDADSLNTRGVRLLEQGASAQAGDYFAQALKHSPDDEKALNNMGLSLYARGRTAEALTYYERAVEVNPDNIETYVNMGIALRSRRDFTRAAAVFQKALALNPAHPETLYNYGLLLKDMGQQDASRICFEQFLKTAPPYLQAVADSVRAYLQTSAAARQ